MEENIVLIDDLSIRDKIHTILGVKVMLDFDLAKIYGYSTGAFNRQVKNNAEKFEGDDFMFRITIEELNELVKCKNYISRKANMFKGQCSAKGSLSSSGILSWYSDGGRRFSVQNSLFEFCTEEKRKIFRTKPDFRILYGKR